MRSVGMAWGAGPGWGVRGACSEEVAFLCVLIGIGFAYATCQWGISVVLFEREVWSIESGTVCASSFCMCRDDVFGWWCGALRLGLDSIALTSVCM